MFHSLIKNLLARKFGRDRRGAIAVAMAIMIVPILLLSGAAVDFARISAARTVLQASVDSAAIAATGAWQLSESSTDASTVATSTYNNTGATLPFVASLPTAENISLYCSGAATTAQCGGNAAYSTTFPSNCAAGAEYCTVVSATVLMTNSLLRFVIPSEYLSATAASSAAFPSANNGVPSQPGNRFGAAGGLGGGYAYPVPMSGNTPNYGSLPTPNANCARALGPIQFEASSSTGGSSSCNYLFISDSLGDGGTGGTITSNAADPIAFTFVEYAGKNQNETIDNTHYTTSLMVATNSSSTAPTTGYAYYPAGLSIPNGDTTCERHEVGCTPGLQSSTQLYGQCPAHNLYGTMFTSNGNAYTSSSIPTGEPGDPGTPASDAISNFTSAAEVLGYPPTYLANSALTPFVTNIAVKQTVNGTNYWVEAVCPNYAIPSGSTINAPISNNYVSAGNANLANANIFATWYPTGISAANWQGITGLTNSEVAYTDSSNTTSQALTEGNGVYAADIYPPAVAGCTAATYALDGNVTPATSNPWWGWSESPPTALTNLDTADCDPTTNAATPASIAATPPAPAVQSASYSDCALIIQDLGTNVPQIQVQGVSEAALPDYYNIITSDAAGKNVVALDPVYDDTTYFDPVTGATITNTDTAGDVPGGDVPANSQDGSTTPLAVAAQPLQPLSSSAPTFTTTGSSYWITDSTEIPYGYNGSGVPATPFAGTQYAFGDAADTTNTKYYLWIQQPAQEKHADATNSAIIDYTYDEALPAFTSHQCYNPQANGTAAGTYSGDNNNGTAVDPVSNPQLGAILCNTAPPHNYALYWNDMGGDDTDDLGYWNAIEVFTCSTPPSTNAGGGGSLLSG